MRNAFDDRFYTMRGKAAMGVVGFDRHETMQPTETQSPQPPTPVVFHITANPITFRKILTERNNGLGNLIMDMQQDTNQYKSYAFSTQTKELKLIGTGSRMNTYYNNGYADAGENARRGRGTGTREYVMYYFPLNNETSLGQDGGILGEDASYKYLSSGYRYSKSDGSLSSFPLPPSGFSNRGKEYSPLIAFNSSLKTSYTNIGSNRWKINSMLYYNASSNTWDECVLISSRAIDQDPDVYTSISVFPSGVPLVTASSSLNAPSAYYQGNGTFEEMSGDSPKSVFAEIEGTTYYRTSSPATLYVWENNAYRSVLTDTLATISFTGTNTYYKDIGNNRHILINKWTSSSQTRYYLYFVDFNNNLLRRVGQLYEGFKSILGFANDKLFYQSGASEYSCTDFSTTIPTVTVVTNDTQFGNIRSFVTGINGRYIGVYGNTNFVRFERDGTTTPLFTADSNMFMNTAVNANPGDTYSKNISTFINGSIIYIAFTVYYDEYGEYKSDFDQVIAYDTSNDNWWLINDKKGGFKISDNVFVGTDGATSYKIGGGNTATGLQEITMFCQEYIGENGNILLNSNLA